MCIICCLGLLSLTLVAFSPMPIVLGCSPLNSTDSKDCSRIAHLENYHLYDRDMQATLQRVYYDNYSAGILRPL